MVAKSASGTVRSGRVTQGGELVQVSPVQSVAGEESIASSGPVHASSRPVRARARGVDVMRKHGFELGDVVRYPSGPLIVLGVFREGPFTCVLELREADRPNKYRTVSVNKYHVSKWKLIDRPPVGFDHITRLIWRPPFESSERHVLTARVQRELTGDDVVRTEHVVFYRVEAVKALLARVVTEKEAEQRAKEKGQLATCPSRRPRIFCRRCGVSIKDRAESRQDGWCRPCEQNADPLPVNRFCAYCGGDFAARARTMLGHKECPTSTPHP